MKSGILITLVASLCALTLTPRASADHSATTVRFSHHCSCGMALYAQNVFRGYDSSGRAIWTQMVINGSQHSDCGRRSSSYRYRGSSSGTRYYSGSYYYSPGYSTYRGYGGYYQPRISYCQPRIIYRSSNRSCGSRRY